MKYKRLRTGALLVVLAIFIVGTVMAAGITEPAAPGQAVLESRTVVGLRLDGQPALNYNGTVYVPLEAVAKQYGQRVSYDDDANTVAVELEIPTAYYSTGALCLGYYHSPALVPVFSGTMYSDTMLVQLADICDEFSPIVTSRFAYAMYIYNNDTGELLDTLNIKADTTETIHVPCAGVRTLRVELVLQPEEVLPDDG